MRAKRTDFSPGTAKKSTARAKYALGTLRRQAVRLHDGTRSRYNIGMIRDMVFSDFGKKLAGQSGILQLMDDLGKPLPQGVPAYRLGGGNPARIPQVEAAYRRSMEAMLADGETFENVIAHYDAPQGRITFIEAVAEYFSQAYGWKIGPENVGITNGSQSAYFYLFNLFSGVCDGGAGSGYRKTIVFPLVPEYVGYADQGIAPDTFVGIPARHVCYPDRTFKYFIDFERLEAYLAAHPETGALCVSRPTNPTGNVLTDTEIQKLAALAGTYNLPLFVDNAYGVPFPDIIFTENAAPYWDENVVLSLSLSKIGLPSLRTGIIIADRRIISTLANLNAIVALASGSLGQALAERLIRSGELVRLAQTAVRPFYEERSLRAQEWIREFFDGGDYAVHRSEGAIFLWLLFKDLRIPAKKLYAKLKERGVITVPGEYFFFGLESVQEHEHYDKCLRINYSCDPAEVREGLRIIGELYRENR